MMPIDEDVLGFSNKWYPPAIASAELRSIAGSEIRVVTPVYFVATKLEAFHGRGANDVAMSHDVEDIVTVVDGRPEIVGEIASAASGCVGLNRAQSVKVRIATMKAAAREAARREA